MMGDGKRLVLRAAAASVVAAMVMEAVKIFQIQRVETVRHL